MRPPKLTASKPSQHSYYTPPQNSSHLRRRGILHFNAEFFRDGFRGFAPFENCSDHKVGAADHVAAGENLFVGGLVDEAGACSADATVGQHFDAVVGQPVLRVGAKAEGDDHDIGRQVLLAAFDRLGPPPAVGIGLAQTRLDKMDAFNLVLSDAVAHDLDRLAVEHEFDAFVPGVLDFLAAAGHVGLVAAIGAGDRERTLSDGGAHAIHRGVATSQHHDALAVDIDIGKAGIAGAEHAVNIPDQKRQ